MKELLLIILASASLSVYSQKSDYALVSDIEKVSLVPNKVDLHLSKYEDQYKTGKAFIVTGAAIYALSAGIVIANDKNLRLGMATGVIGGAFQLFGFINLVDARRHQKKAWAAERTATR